MQFEQNLVDECAAFLYWKFLTASKMAEQEFNIDILNSNGYCLTDQTSAFHIVNEALSTMNYQIDIIYYPILYKQINQSLVNFISNNNKPFGRLYLEQLFNGKSSYIDKVSLGELDVSPSNIKESDNIQTLGQLVLRTPLPACVFSETNPESPIIKIKDTNKALGSDVNMYMVIATTQETDNGVIIYGDINIPTPNPELANSWKNIIPNSFPSYSLFKAETPEEEYKVEFGWVD